jgi:protein-arginine kinase activator protein McsA
VTKPKYECSGCGRPAILCVVIVTKDGEVAEKTHVCTVCASQVAKFLEMDRTNFSVYDQREKNK